MDCEWKVGMIYHGYPRGDTTPPLWLSPRGREQLEVAAKTEGRAETGPASANLTRTTAQNCVHMAGMGEETILGRIIEVGMEFESDVGSSGLLDTVNTYFGP